VGYLGSRDRCYVRAGVHKCVEYEIVFLLKGIGEWNIYLDTVLKERPKSFLGSFQLAASHDIGRFGGSLSGSSSGTRWPMYKPTCG
jgi:hypothetical protein